eukprot:jgi/Tetstr1/427407/TSEL_017571.t1
MYLQVRSHAHVAKRRLFASARLVASVKKQGEGGPPDLGARDSVLIHDVRLIAKELLGPRAVIVHTDLRNDYSEAWRRGTFMQCHIDCSPLQHVIPALLASLSTDSFLLVDDRVEKCDKTSEVTDGAGRFNVDGEYLVGMPEHVWPALHAFRKSIEASSRHCRAWGNDHLCAISLGKEDEEFADTMRLAVALTSPVALLWAIRLRIIVI